MFGIVEGEWDRQGGMYDPLKEKEATRRRKMAEMMAKQAAPRDTQVIGGYAVEQSPLEGLARAIQGGMAQYQLGRADKAEADAEMNRQQRLAQAISGLKDGDVQGAAINLMEYPDTFETGLGLYGKTLGNSAPSNVQEWEYYNNLSDEDKKAYLGMKRADKTLNLGGQQVVLDPYGKVKEAYDVTPKPEDMPDFRRQQKAAEKIGAMEGEAKQNFIGVEDEANKMISRVEDLLNDSGFSAVVGMKNPFKGAIPFATDSEGYPSVVAGSPAASAVARLKEIRGGQFLQAYQQIRGAGQITEVEGTKAESAIGRMMVAQSEKDFREAANDFIENMKLGVKKARQKANIPSQTQVESRPLNIPSDARQAPDGNWYSPDPNRQGKYIKW